MASGAKSCAGKVLPVAQQAEWPRLLPLARMPSGKIAGVVGRWKGLVAGHTVRLHVAHLATHRAGAGLLGVAVAGEPALLIMAGRPEFSLLGLGPAVAVTTKFLSRVSSGMAECAEIPLLLARFRMLGKPLGVVARGREAIVTLHARLRGVAGATIARLGSRRNRVSLSENPVLRPVACGAQLALLCSHARVAVGAGLFPGVVAPVAQVAQRWLRFSLWLMSAGPPV